jgi:signal transduction histidine kinase
LSPAKAGVKVQVTDTGIGIAPEFQPLIFERYKQFNGDGHTQQGMGIGLAIVRKIIELHQATIAVASEPGRGTAFQFVLPAAPPLSASWGG